VPPRTIERIQAPSQREFRHRFERSRRPVVIEGALSAWPALSRWTPEYLAGLHGEARVTLRVSDLDSPQIYDGDPLACLMRREARFGDYLVEARSAAGKRRAYLQYCDIENELPLFAKDVRKPIYCPRFFVSRPFLWMCGDGTVNPLHYDYNHVLMAQIIGHKRYVLFSPRDSSKISTRFDRIVWRTTPVDVEAPDRTLFPHYDEADAYECELAPGELLFIPYRFWHYARAHAFNVSVSSWWEPDVPTKLADIAVFQSLRPLRKALRRLGLGRSAARQTLRRT
jgi:[protein]-arginine 3-hydroxylase / protease